MHHLKTTLRSLLSLTLITGVLYPLAVTLCAQTLFPHQSTGSLITRGDRLIGSELIGQQFTSPIYFWGRLSATAPVAYNASASAGSNLGPRNPALLKASMARVQQLKDAGAMQAPIPMDLITASASGLDPHISPQAAEVQIARVAQARGIGEDQVRKMVYDHLQARDLGILGEPRINVLKLNLALDAAATTASRTHDR